MDLPSGNKTIVPVKMPRKYKKRKRDLKDTRFLSRMFRSHESEVRLTNPSEFFDKMSKPAESRLYNWIKEVEEKSEEMLDVTGRSKIVEIDLHSGKWRWRLIKDTNQLREIMRANSKAHETFLKLREFNYNKMIRGREDMFGGFGFSDDSGVSNTAFPTRPEYTPLIGTPFFKQLYLQDYWEMHSKCFWYSNYSGIAKLIVDQTRNFVMGRGFSVSFKNQKAQDVWNAYEERSNIQEEARNWCDELTKFGENMLKKIPTKDGLIHRSFDPSTIWEIVTDPENINDVKYYHQQYNTQYQLYATKDAPTSKYIIDQIPPELVIHTKVNVTSYEKRGRSDLLAALLYFKYFEDYMQAKMIRAKNESAFIWDVSIDGSDEDVQAYINNTESIADVPPGSENVHNKAIERTPLSPQFGVTGADQIAQDIMSYVAMAVNIPVTYFGSSFTASSGTKAGALVATEPVAKKMVERQRKLEFLLRKIVRDVLISEKMDPTIEFEINFPEIMEEDKNDKINNLIIARQEKAITHRRMAELMTKELKITNYDYDDEQKAIQKEAKDPNLANLPSIPNVGLTQKDSPGNDDSGRALNRDDVKKQNTSF